jgi:glycosyltransferase involved in cell wall biosynthesis
LPGRRLRILTVTHNYPRFTGDPAGAFVARIAEGVAAEGHEVEVLAPHATGSATRENLRGVQLHRFRYGPDVLERVAYTGGLHQSTLRSPLAALGFPGFLVGFARALRAAERRFKPDLIHAHWWFPAGWFASRHKSLPYVITSHGSDARLLDRGALVKALARPVFKGAAKVTAVSRFLAEDIVRSLAGVVQDVVLTPMPIDIEHFERGATTEKTIPPQILYAGNLVPTKGVDVLLHAAAELSRRGVAYHLKILGEGPARSSLERLAEQLGISSVVAWSSFVPQQQMAAEYGASTVTVLPSRGQAEGLGLTLAEALLAGSAVVGTPAGGIPELVRHEKTGLIARDGDSADLATQIARLLADAQLRERLIKTGRDYVLATYSPPAAIGRFLKIYDVVANDHSLR